MGELTRISEQANKKTKRRESLVNSRPSTASAVPPVQDGGVNGSDAPLQNGLSGDGNGVTVDGGSGL